MFQFHINFELIAQNKLIKRLKNKFIDAEHRAAFKIQLITNEVKSRESDNVVYNRKFISEAI